MALGKDIEVNRRPIIGITTGRATEELPYATVTRFSVTANYAAAVNASGGAPILLPPCPGNEAALLEIVDGLLFTGGGDLRPSRYGDQDVHPTTYGLDDQRDEFELQLLRAAIARDMPVLCICRGIQVLNVALGGSLIQDIPDQVGRDIEHGQEDSGLRADQPAHRVNIAPESRLRAVHARDEFEVNSFHHQAIKRVADGLQVVATAPDGVVEAVELPSRRWLLAVQWHPELMFERHPEHLTLFQALVDASVPQTSPAAR